jgi:parallel beta-helix repeat protein
LVILGFGPVSEESQLGAVYVQLAPPPLSGKLVVVSQNLTAQLGGATAVYRNMTSALNAANEGDTILVKPGIYNEQVIINNKPWITIIGADKNGVILDGKFALANGIQAFESPGISVKNLTVRNYLGNGIVFTKSDHWLMDDVVSVNNRVYGLYALASRYGTINNSMAKGSGDSGLYIGEVSNCNCVIQNSTAYGNTLGYSGTRANGVIIRNSRFVNNSVGIGPNTLLPDFPPLLTGKWSLPFFATNHTIENNTVEDNNNRTVLGVGFSQAYGVPIGTGIALMGSFGNTIRNNVIEGNKLWGIAEWYFLAPSVNNVFESNTFGNNGQDFWNDGTNFFDCSNHESASGDVPFSCSLPSFVRLALPNPIKEMQLLTSIGRPGSDPTDTRRPAYEIVGLTVLLALGAVSAGKEPSVLKGNLVSRRTRIAGIVYDILLVGDIYLLVISIFTLLSFGASSVQDLASSIASVTFLLAPLSYFIFVTIAFLYGFVFDATRGRTLGKSLFGLKLVPKAGARVTIAMLFIKNLSVYVDSIAAGLLGLVFILLKRRTFSEIASGTYLAHVANAPKDKN